VTSVVESPEFVDAVERRPGSERRADRFPTGLVAVAVGLSIVLRARFLVTPLTSD